MPRDAEILHREVISSLRDIHEDLLRIIGQLERQPIRLVAWSKPAEEVDADKR